MAPSAQSLAGGWMRKGECGHRDFRCGCNSADLATPPGGACGMDRPIVDVDVVIGAVDRVPTPSAAAYATVTPYPQLALDTGREAFRATGDNPGVAVLHSSRGSWLRRTS